MPVRRAGADQLEQGRTGRLIAVLLRAFEALGVDRQHRQALLGGHAPADGLDIIADHSDDAGRVHERGFGLIAIDQLDQRLVQLGLAAVDHVLFAQVRREAHAVQFGAGRQRAADVPGVSGTADRAVDQVQRIGHGVQHHARAAEHAGPLADRPGHALLFAIHRKRRSAVAMDLGSAFFQQGDHGIVLSPLECV